MSGLDVLAVMGEDRYAVLARIKDVVQALKLDERLRGSDPERSALDLPYAIEILEEQLAKLSEVRTVVAEMAVALRVANRVLNVEGRRFSGLDQNPHGVRDTVYSAITRCTTTPESN